jgi:hypothetical protein
MGYIRQNIPNNAIETRTARQIIENWRAAGLNNHVIFTNPMTRENIYLKNLNMHRAPNNY